MSKRNLPLIVGLATAGLIGLVVAAGWGPYGCTGACSVAAPNPDASAADALARLNPGVAIGDIVIICNGSMCTDYTKQQDNKYAGSNRREQTPPGEVPDLPPLIRPPGSGGGGGGGGDGSNPPGGNGGWTGGGGGGSGGPKPIVIVYPPE